MTQILTEKQAQAIQSKAKRKVLNFGRRSGKTTELAYEAMITSLTIDKAKTTYYAQTFDDARNIAWDIFLDVLGNCVIKKNETRLEITVLTKTGSTSLVSLKGWESVVTSQKGRGTENDLLLIDEVAFLRGFNKLWDTVLEPTLLTTRGRAVFSSTPNGFNDFHELSNRAQKRKDWFYLHATSYDNPHNPPEELDRLKKEKSRDSFAQEYMADFRTISGLVCKWFDREIHVQEAGEMEDWYEVIDGGYSDPLAHLLIGTTENAVYVVDGFRKKGLLTSEIREMRDMIVGDRTLIEGWADNDNPRLLDELDLDLAPVEKLPNESKTWDETLAQKMDQYGRVVEGLSGIYIDPKLDWLIKEIESLTWIEKSGGEILPKWNDHRLDGHHYDGIRALAYFLISFSRERGGIIYWEGTTFIEKVAEKDEGMYNPEQAFEHQRNPFT